MYFDKANRNGVLRSCFDRSRWLSRIVVWYQVSRSFRKSKLVMHLQPNETGCQLTSGGRTDIPFTTAHSLRADSTSNLPPHPRPASARQDMSCRLGNSGEEDTGHNLISVVPTFDKTSARRTSRLDQSAARRATSTVSMHRRLSAH